MESARNRRKVIRVFIRDICSPGIPSVYVDLPSMFLAEPVVGAQGCGSWVRGVTLGIDFFFARQDEWKWCLSVLQYLISIVNLLYACFRA